jgi:hypothetical protein
MDNGIIYSTFCELKYFAAGSIAPVLAPFNWQLENYISSVFLYKLNPLPFLLNFLLGKFYDCREVFLIISRFSIEYLLSMGINFLSVRT